MNLANFPRDNHYRFFEAAYMAALLSPGVSGKKHNTFRLGASLVYKKILLTTKFNSYKTHPALLLFSKYPVLHAEASAILSIGIDNCYDTTLYVIRIKRNKDIAMAKPCSSCNLLIKHVGIKKVFYTTGEGYEQL